MQQPAVSHDDDAPFLHPALALALRLIVAAKTNPSVSILKEITSQLQASPVPAPASLLSVALHPALPLLAKDHPEALQYIQTLVRLCPDPIPLAFWPTAIGALSAASRRLKNECSRLDCILLMRAMFTPAVGKQFSDSSFSSPFAHVVGALLETTRLESLKALRVAAVEAIEALIIHVDAKALTPITPGLLSGLAAVAAGDFKSGSNVICSAIHCFTSVMQIVFSLSQDDSFRFNASMLSSSILRRRFYEGPEPTARVRSSLVTAATALLKLPLCEEARAAWIDSLLALAEDNIVAEEALSALQSVPAISSGDLMRRLSKISKPAPRLQDVRSAMRAIRLCPSSELENLWRTEKDKVSRILSSLVAIDTRAVIALQPRTISRLSPYYQISLSNFPLVPEAAFSLVETLIQCLSYDMLVDLFTTCLAEPGPTWLLIVDCIIRSASDLPAEVSDRIISDDLFALDPDSLTILLRCIGSLALRLREEFRPLLLHSLFPVVLLIAHSSPTVSQAALATVDRIAYALDYDGFTALLADNVDYLVDAISFRLSSPDALNASRLLERLFSFENSSTCLAPLLIDTITTVIDCLYEPKLDPELALSFFRVLNFAARALLPVPKRDLEQVSTNGCYYEPEQVAMRLSHSISRFRNLRKRKDEFEKSFESNNREEFVPPHLQKEFENSKVEGINDDVDIDDKPELIDANSMEASKSQEPSTEMKTIVLIVDRCRHFIETPDLHHRHAVLEVVASCLQALSSSSELLLPQVAKIWDPLKLAFSPNSSRFVIQKALDVAEVVVSVCPDFVAHRVSTDLWPSMKRVLIAEQRTLANALNPNVVDRASVAAQGHALRLLYSALRHPTSCNNIIGEIATVMSAYLSESMPSVLQEEARKLFSLICDVDPDTAWWSLVSLISPSNVPIPNNCIPLPLQWHAPNPRLFQRNVAHVLSRLQTLPEVRFEDYLNREE